MFTVVITEKGGAQKRLTFEEPEVTIGRVPGNDIVLAKGNVSKRHSRIVLKDSRFIVVDLKSTNGTYVNGRKITSPLVVKEGDKIYIGDFIMTLEGDPAQAAPSDAMRQPSVLPGGEAQESQKAAPVSAPPPLPSRAPDPIDDGIPAVLRSGAPSSRTSQPQLGPEAASAVIASYKASVPSPAVSSVPSVPPVLSAFDAEPEPVLDRTQAQAAAPDVNGIVARAVEERDRFPRSSAEPLTTPNNNPPNTDPPPKSGSNALPLPPRPVTRSVPPVLSARTSSIPPATRDDLRSLMLRLGRELDTDNADAAGLLDEKRWQRAERAIQGKLGELLNEGAIARGADKALLASAALHEAVGLGPLDGLLAEDDVQQVIIERFDRVFVDRGTGLKAEETAFSSPQGLLTAVRRLLAQAGLLERNEPTFDVSLPNGLHIVGALPAAATEGPVISVRRRPRKIVPLAELEKEELLDAEQMKRLSEALSSHKNLLFVGPRATDLASLISSVLAECPKEERVALFEYAPEIAVGERSAICFKRGVSALSELIARARHFRPERCVIHEVARAELSATITTLLSGSNGSMASMERPSAREALTELGLAAKELGVDGVDQLQRAVHLVVGLVREGTRVRLAGMFTLVVEGQSLKLVEL